MSDKTNKIICCKNESAYNALANVFPTVSGCAIGEHYPYDNGGFAVSHPFAEEDLAALQMQLADYFANGDIWITDLLPEDWTSEETP